ncbi:hypothetical protein [Halomonas halocynthiae]|uniref:hypothetical protein n=1 Tax=Halomonas halocynthiae TaxID=176290 RepID=UPI00041AC116|nr:hypothetical protein [Halomonas halocynthiae]
MIHLLTHEHWVGQLPAPEHTGISPIFKARLKIEGESRRCYVKPLPDMIECGTEVLDNQEVVSEALGYILAKYCGLPVPHTAGIIVLPRDYIPADVLQHADSVTPQGKRQEVFIAWFSEDMRTPNLIQHHMNGASEELQSRLVQRISRYLAKHDQAPAIASFDEWTLNSDRHPGNLLQSRDGQLMLIDHGRLFIGPSWKPSQLANSPPTCTNRLIGFIEKNDPSWSRRLPTQSQRHVAYNGFNVYFQDSGEKAARETLARLMMEEDDIGRVVSFLSSRLQPEHYRTAIGTLL